MKKLPSALIKLSWKTDAAGRVAVCPEAVTGGICRTAVTVGAGKVLTASHALEQLWAPDAGYDAVATWIAHPDGTTHPLRLEAITQYHGLDLARIDCPPSDQIFDVWDADDGPLDQGICLGYAARRAPFDICRTAHDVSLAHVEIAKALLPMTPIALQPTTLMIEGQVVFINDVPGFVMARKASAGLSGGPVIDPAKGKVLGICCFGKSADETSDALTGAVDIRGMQHL